MSTDNKQTQEVRVELMGDSAYVISEHGGRIFLNGETIAPLKKEAILIHHLTGKGPKELWDENERLQITNVFKYNIQLSERVKELKTAIEKMCCYDGEYRDAFEREAIGRSALKRNF